MIPVTLAAEGSSDEAQDWVRDWSDKKTDWNLSDWWTTEIQPRNL